VKIFFHKLIKSNASLDRLKRLHQMIIPNHRASIPSLVIEQVVAVTIGCLFPGVYLKWRFQQTECFRSGT